MKLKTSDFYPLDNYREVDGKTIKIDGKRILDTTSIKTPHISDDEFKMRVILALEDIAKNLKGTEKVLKALNKIDDTLTKVGLSIEQHS